MPFTVEFDEAGFIHAAYEGDLTMQGITEMMSSVGRVIKERGCFLVLSDYRKARMAVDIMDLYRLPKLVMERGRDMGLSAYKVKRALVIPPAAYDKFRFFETVSINSMQKVKLFTEEDEARGWLLAP